MVTAVRSLTCLLPTFEDLKIEGEKKEEEAIYGLKFSNLVRLEKLLGKIDGVIIPLPMGFSHQAVAQFLKKHVPKVFERWEELGHKYNQHLKEQNKLADSAFLESIGKSLFEIRQMIMAAFSDENALTPEIEVWLEQLSKQTAQLMVRSSGVEDSQKIMNAGGNLSISNVQPKSDLVNEAIGRVVASYFELKTLKNQIDQGSNPFSMIPTLSVMLQELISEKPDDEIPVSAVMFTQEPSYSEKGFHVTRISCTYGHGEAVVNDLGIGCDTVLVTTSRSNPKELFEIYQNRPKYKRLVPVEGAGLSSEENPESLVKSRCLTPEMVQRLVSLAKLIEDQLGPTDLELIIRQNTIYIVQARAIVRQVAQPTYLKSTRENTLLGKMLVVGKPQVQSVQLDEILVCHSLQEAEQKFLSTKHKVIVVGKEEPINSHPVVNFSSISIPCFHFQNITKIQMLFDNLVDNQMLALCPQGGLLQVCHADPLIVDGYFSHPADTSMSMDIEPPQVERSRYFLIDDLLRALKEAETKEAVAKAIEALASCEPARRLEEGMKVIQAPFLHRLKAVFDRVLKEIEVCYHSSAGPLERLFYVKTLETLINSHGVGIINHSTLGNAFGYIFEEEARRKLAKTVRQDILDRFHFVSHYAINECPAWEMFLEELTALKGQERLIKQFAEFLRLLKECDTLTYWLNYYFINTDSQLPATQLMQNSLKVDLELVRSLHRHQKRLTEIEQTSNRPDQIWKQLEPIRTFLTRSLFYMDFAVVTPLERMIAIQCIAKFIEVGDRVIKRVKTDDVYSIDDKVTIVKGMVETNLNTLIKWNTHLLNSDIPIVRDWSLPKYYQMLKDAFNDAIKKTDTLLPSQGFSVGAATLSSRAYFDRHLPQTLEDLFSVIHQNLLFCVARLTSKNLDIESFLKQSGLILFEDAYHMLAKLRLQGGREGDFMSLQLAKNKVVAQFNYPMQHHSAMVDLEYDQQQQEIALKVRLFGQSRNRWSNIDNWLKILHRIGMVTLAEPLLYHAQECAFVLQVTHSDQLEAIKTELEQIFLLTIEEFTSDAFDRLATRIHKKGLNLKAGEWAFENPLVSTVFKRFLLEFLKSSQGQLLFEKLQKEYAVSDQPKLLDKQGEHFADFMIACGSEMYKQMEPVLLRFVDRRPRWALKVFNECILFLTADHEAQEKLALQTIKKYATSDEAQIIKELAELCKSFVKDNIQPEGLETILASSLKVDLYLGEDLLRVSLEKKMVLKNLDKLLEYLEMRLKASTQLYEMGILLSAIEKIKNL